jgi:hypothetical protein
MTTKHADQVRCGGAAPGQETGPDCPRPTGRLTHHSSLRPGTEPDSADGRGALGAYRRRVNALSSASRARPLAGRREASPIRAQAYGPPPLVKSAALSMRN